ncbi:MAG: ATP-binding protein, partial [Myxococcota bacterium]
MTENQHVEYKQAWRDEYLRWICGFANADGGVLVIGKNDKGEVTGIGNAARLLEEIPNKVRDILGILVDVNLHHAGDLHYFEIVVEPYPYPVSYKGEYHYRSGSTKQELKGAALDKFLLRKQGRRWDAVPVPGVKVADLDPRALQRFRQRAALSQRVSAELLQDDDAGLVDKLHLIDGGRLKRAAVLLFHPEPERFVSGAFVKIGRFGPSGELKSHDEVRGPLLLQVDQCLDVLRNKYLTATVGFAGEQRVERYPVPEAALRESLLNALAHKDYSGAAPVQISVYDDKVLFWNNGELHPGWTVATLTAKHPSQPYNPDVANALFRAGLIEAWGSGIDRIVAACAAEGSPPPLLRADTGGMWLE